jgi:hypothetical protein
MHRSWKFYRKAGKYLRRIPCQYHHLGIDVVAGQSRQRRVKNRYAQWPLVEKEVDCIRALMGLLGPTALLGPTRWVAPTPIIFQVELIEQ